VDVETTGTNPDRDKIIEFGICPFEYNRQNRRIYRVLGGVELWAAIRWVVCGRSFQPIGDAIVAALNERPGHPFERVSHVGGMMDSRGR
jgi:DNA polymerase III epsilon subunit-like protein